MQRQLGRLGGEPLVQFLALGVLVFAIDLFVLGKADNPRRISVNDARYREIVDIFEENQGRQPTGEEVRDLIIKWTQNEILYREAIAMGLDKGDEMIRSRMVLKLRDILFNNLIVETPAEETLRQWFADNRSAYDRPELIDFEQFLASDLDRESAAGLAAELGSDVHPDAYGAAFRQYPRRIDDNLFAVFDAEDAQAMIDAPTGQWVAVESDLGWHLARVTARYPRVEADFDKVRTTVARDWREAARKRELSEALSEIVAQYDISYEFTADLVEQSLASTDPALYVSPQ